MATAPRQPEGISISQLCAAITRGSLDANLDEITASIRFRLARLRNMDRLQKVAVLCVGDSVRFNIHAKPDYLEGLEAKVIGKNRRKIVVDLLKKCGKYQHGLKVEPFMLDIVTPEQK